MSRVTDHLDGLGAGFRARLQVPLHRWTWRGRGAAMMLTGISIWMVVGQSIRSGVSDTNLSGDARGATGAADLARLRAMRARALARIEAAEQVHADAVAMSGTAAAEPLALSTRDAPLVDDGLVALVGRLASQAAIRVDRFEPGSIEHDTDWSRRGIVIAASGSYAAITNWIASLGDADRPLAIDALRIERGRVERGTGEARAELHAAGIHTGKDTASWERRRGDAPLPLNDPFSTERVVSRQVVGRLASAGRIIELVDSASVVGALASKVGARASEVGARASESEVGVAEENRAVPGCWRCNSATHPRFRHRDERCRE